MATVPHIPDEIFVEILSCLPCSDIARVSLVSRRLQSISQPLLYKEPELYNRGRYPSPLQLFARTLLTPGCETLVTHVRRVTVQWRNEEMGLHDPDIPLFTVAASMFGLEGRRISEDVQVVLLLHLLPRLYSLHLYPPDNCNMFRNYMDFHASLDSVAILPIALQSVQEFWCDSHAGMGPKTLVTLLRLPNIRTIATPVFGDIELQLRGNNAVAVAHIGVSTVTRLELPCVRMPFASLMRILQIPRALTHFSYCALRTRGDDFDFPGFWMALEVLRETLQTLVLSFSRVIARPTYRDNEIPNTVGSLRGWPALRNVSSSLIPLLGNGPQTASPRHFADVLPAGICTLEILKDGYWTSAEAVHEVLVLLGQKEAAVPRLERVVFGERVVMDRQVKERLMTACEEASVVLVGLV